jgi:hypothetical protein
MSEKYEIYSGRRVVSVQYSVSPLQAAVDYVRSFGTTDAEITRLGVNSVSWRGARFTATLAPVAPQDTAPTLRDIAQPGRALRQQALEPPHRSLLELGEPLARLSRQVPLVY